MFVGFGFPFFEEALILNKIKIKSKNINISIKFSSLFKLGIVIRIGRFLVQTPLGARPGLGTQPRYKIPGNHQVEYVKTLWLTLGKWGYPLNNGPNSSQI